MNNQPTVKRQLTASDFAGLTPLAKAAAFLKAREAGYEIVLLDKPAVKEVMARRPGG